MTAVANGNFPENPGNIPANPSPNESLISSRSSVQTSSLTASLREKMKASAICPEPGRAPRRAEPAQRHPDRGLDPPRGRQSAF
nr:hypothetical protein [Tanacetum cinerariifolium]